MSEGCSEDVQCHALSLLSLATKHSVMAASEFNQLGGVKLIQQVLRTPEAAVGKKIADVSLGSVCSFPYFNTPYFNVPMFQYSRVSVFPHFHTPILPNRCSSHGVQVWTGKRSKTSLYWDTSCWTGASGTKPLGASGRSYYGNWSSCSPLIVVPSTSSASVRHRLSSRYCSQAR